MASGRHGKGLAVEEEDKFPEGLRVLAVDDSPTCLRVLKAVLNMLKYKPTTVADGRTALKMLREGGEDQFDLVITDVHMPDMDGFELLEHIGLEMDLPVIMLSVDGEKETVYKGIEHGACDYIVKPVNVKKLQFIWQHVVRKNHTSSGSDWRVAQPASAQGGRGGAKTKKKRNGGDGSDENRESTHIRSTWKKPRVSWDGELHNRFLEVIKRLGVNRAVPKTILRMMNVHNLSRESVASHLQKYRLYLKRVTDDQANPNPLGDSSTRPKCYMNLSYQETLPLLPALCACGSHNLGEAPPSILEPHGLSIQPRNWVTGRAGNGGSSMPGQQAVPWLPDTSHHASVLPVGSLVKDHPMQDTVSPVRSDKAYVSVLREKLLEASSVVPSSHPSSGSSSFAEMPNGGMSRPAANQFQVQPPELIGQFTGPMYAAPSALAATQFPYLAGSSSNSWQNNVGPSDFRSPMAGAPLLQSSQLNVPLNNQLPSFGASPAANQMAMFQNEQQNQMAGISINNTASVGVISEYQMTPLFNMASNTAPLEMTNDNFSPMTVNGGSTNSPLPNLGSPVAPPAQMVNGGEDASGIPPVQDDQQAPSDDEPTYSTNALLEDLFTSVVNHDYNPDDDDAFFGGEY